MKKQLSFAVKKWALLLAVLLWVFACSDNSSDPPFSGPPEFVTPTIVNTFDHDSTSFTQGLLWANGLLYESGGLYRQSTLREVEIASGTVLNSVALDDQYFAEGLALFDSRLVQLTWLENTALIYSFPDMTLQGTFSYSGEGWGLTTNGSEYIMSNGTDRIVFRDEDFRVTREIRVTIDGASLPQLNELEYANGSIYANVWRDDKIYEIDPENGAVKKVIDCAQLWALAGDGSQSIDVLNGIAYRPDTGTFYCTGKLWPKLFEIEIP